MKIFLVGGDNVDKYKIAHSVAGKCEGLSICPVFTTSLKQRGVTDDKDKIYYMDGKQVEEAYLNNAFMWVHASREVTRGATMYDMYDHSIFVMGFQDFNNMSSPVLERVFMKRVSEDDLEEKQSNSVICYFDTTTMEDRLQKQEAKYAMDRVFSYTHLYFCDEDEETIAEVITNYVDACRNNDKSRVEAILDENS